MMQLLRTGGVKLAAGTKTIMTRRMSTKDVKSIVAVSLVSPEQRNINAHLGGGCTGGVRRFEFRN